MWVVWFLFEGFGVEVFDDRGGGKNGFYMSIENVRILKQIKKIMLRDLACKVNIMYSETFIYTKSLFIVENILLYKVKCRDQISWRKLVYIRVSILFLSISILKHYFDSII